MKYLNLYSTLFLFTVLIFPHTSFAVINELYQLQKSLQKLTEFFSKSQTVTVKPKITTYEELKTVMEKAYESKNPDLLNDYEQTVAITTAKYLAQELLKEGNLPNYIPGSPYHSPSYIPFMAYVTQQVTEQYPDKTINLHCVSLGAGELDKELLLIRALRFVGYKTITLIAIDLMYSRIQKKILQHQFTEWCKNYNIPVSFDPKVLMQNGVNLELFQDTYHYIQKFYTDNLPKNHLFLMIQPGSGSAIVNINQLRLLIREEKQKTPNYLGIEDENRPDQNIKIYLPYKKSDFFITSIGQQDTIIKNIKEEIQKWTGTTFSESHANFNFTFYQQALMLKLIDTFFISKRETMIGGFDFDISLSFYELIKYTALKPTEPLAFETISLKMKQITDTSGSLEQMYKRYYSED